MQRYPAFTCSLHIAIPERLFLGYRRGTPNFTRMGGRIAIASTFNVFADFVSANLISETNGIMDLATIRTPTQDRQRNENYYHLANG